MAMAGIFIAIGLFLIVQAWGQDSSPLAKRLQVITGQMKEEEKAEFGSLQHKLELMGIKVEHHDAKTVYYLLLGGGALLTFMLAIIVKLPPLGAIILGGIAAYFVKAYIDARISNYLSRIEQEMPAALMEFAALVQLQSSPTEMMRRVSETLGQKSLLSKHLQDYSAWLAQRGPAAWTDIIANASALNPTFGIFMHALSRMAQKGGAGFGKAFGKMAENIAMSLSAREEARARGQSALTAVKIIAGIMLTLITFLAVDPVYRPAVMSLPGQVSIGLSFIMMLAGYWYCVDKINSIY